MKNYRVKLTAVTPLHVGSGYKYSKKEYCIEANGQVTVFDMNKVTEWIAARGRSEYADAFERFMLSGGDNNIRDLLCSRLGMSQSDLKKCELYSMSCGGVGERPRDLMAFMRDTKMRPYVPGSSLKGALRTVLLVKMLRDGGNRGRDDVSDLKEAAKNVEISLLHTLGKTNRQNNALNSIMSGLSVSDSLPFDKNKIIIAKKIDIKVNGEENPLSIMRECAAPGTKLLFSLSISDEAERFISADYIMRAINEFGAYYTDCYLSKFPKRFMENLDGCIFLGGGSGYYSKNIIYPLFGNDMRSAVGAVAKRMMRYSEEHRHDEDMRLGISPHILKCTRVDGKLRQVGICRIELEEKR